MPLAAADRTTVDLVARLLLASLLEHPTYNQLDLPGRIAVFESIERQAAAIATTLTDLVPTEEDDTDDGTRFEG